MAEWKVEGPELKKLVKLTKKKPLAFAYAPGKKADERLVAIDRRKTGAFLGKNLKKESTGPKVAFGTASLNGKLWSLTCEQVVPTMAKTLKAYLKTQNIKVNIEILDIDGNSVESDIEDLPDDPDLMEDDPSDDATDALEDQPAVDDEEQDEESRKKEIAARIKATHHDVMGTDGPTGETLKKVMAAAISLLKSGDLDKAEETVGKLEAALAKIGAAAPKKEDDDKTETSSGPDAVSLAGRAQALKARIDEVAEPARAKLLTALGAAAQAIKGGQLDQASAALDKITAALEKLAGAAAPAANENPEVAAARERLAGIEATAKALDNKEVGAKVIAAAAKASDAINVEDFARASQIMDTLEKAMADAGGAAQASGNAALGQSHDTWVKARADMRTEIATLKAEIDKVTGETEGFEDVSSRSDKLFSYLDSFDGQLEDTLKQLMSASPDEQGALKATAQSIVSRYRSELDNDFFKAVDQNGFVPTNIRGAALASLDTVSTALAA